MNKQRTCPYCDNVLDYRGFDTSIDLITEEWWCENCKEFLYFDEPGIRPQSEDVESDDEVDDDEPFELGVHRMIPGLWRLPHDANGVTSMELVSEDTATVASQPDSAGDAEADIRESLEVINKMTNPQVVQMNIDWITQVMSDSPIATALVLGDLLELFENAATKLQANQGAAEGE